MNILNVNPVMSIALYSGNGSTYNDVNCIVTRYDGEEMLEQHLINEKDIPEIIELLSHSSNRKVKKKKQKTNIINKRDPLSRMILMYCSDSMGLSLSWISESGYKQTTTKSELKNIFWPEILFYIKDNSINVYYSHKNKNGENEFYGFEDLSNTSPTGSVCMGSVKINYKSILNESINNMIDYYEQKFFTSNFSPELRIKDNKLDYKISEKRLTIQEITKKHG